METIAELERMIAADAGLQQVRETLVAQQSDDPGHDLAHSLRVALWTLRIGGAGIDVREGVAAALLHDVVNLPKDSPDRATASEQSAGVARELLPTCGFTTDAVDRMADAIRDHSFSRGATPTTPLGKALQDADRLEALGAIGIFRCISCGVQMGADYFDADDPWAESRALDDKAHSVDHFFTKLLRLADTMTTDAGRAEAVRRSDAMRSFLAQLGHELGRPLP